MAYSTSSFQVSSGQVEEEYLLQVLQRGQKSVHKHLCINKLAYTVTTELTASGQTTYYPHTKQVPYNYSLWHKITHPVQSVGLTLYTMVVQNKSVLATARMLDLFHSMNDGDYRLEYLPEIIEFASIQNSCSTSTIPSKQQLEKLYLNSIFFQGYNSTHNEFYVKNLKLKITKDSATHYHVSFYDETAVANSSLKGIDAETIRNRVSLLVNDPRVQVVAQQHVLQNQSECLNRVIKAKCGDIIHLLSANPSFQNLIFKTNSKHWENEICKFTSNCSVELLPDLFKIVPVHEALQSMLEVRIDKLPLVFILMRLDALQRTQPFRALQFSEQVLQLKYPPNEDLRAQVIAAHMNQVKDDIKAGQAIAYSKLCDVDFIKSCYMHSIMERGLNETHHLFNIENFGFHISLNAKTFEYTVKNIKSTDLDSFIFSPEQKRAIIENIQSMLSNGDTFQHSIQVHNAHIKHLVQSVKIKTFEYIVKNIESTDFDSFMLSPEQKRSIIENIQSMLSNGDTFQHSIQVHNAYIKRLVQSVNINERLTKQILKLKGDQATQALAKKFNSEYSDLIINEWLPIIPSKQTEPQVSSLEQLDEFESLSRSVGVWLCLIEQFRQSEPEKAILLLKRIQKVLPWELHYQELQLNKLELDLHEDNVVSTLKNDIDPLKVTKPHKALKKLSILMKKTPLEIKENLGLARLKTDLEQEVNQQLESDISNREYLLEALAESRHTNNTHQTIVLKHLSVRLEVNDSQKVVVDIDSIRTDILEMEYSSYMKYHIKDSIECYINGTYKNLEHKLASIQTYEIQIDKTNETCPIMHCEFEKGNEVIEIRSWKSDQWVVIAKSTLLAYFDSGQTTNPITRQEMSVDDVREVSPETIKALNIKYEPTFRTFIRLKNN